MAANAGERRVRQHHRARAAEKIDPSCLCRVLRLTLLAPEIVEAIMGGRQAEGVTLPGLMKGFPVEWEGQRAWQATSSICRPSVGFTRISCRSPDYLVEPIRDIGSRLASSRIAPRSRHRFGSASRNRALSDEFYEWPHVVDRLYSRP
jgi:hypothetical protein